VLGERRTLSGEPMLKILANAFDDIIAAYRRRAVWITLATEDIGDQHRRTTLGPLWLLINYFAFAGTFIFVFAPEPSLQYAIYVATGLLVWTYLQDSITQAVTLFEREESFIKGTNLPISVYIMRVTLQNLIRAIYAAAGCIIILVFANVQVTPEWLWSGVGLLIIFLCSPAVVALFGFLGIFFPDSQFIISNLMRVGMFATPIFWTHEGEGGLRGALYHWNPFTYFLDMVRQPIVNGVVHWNSFAVSISVTVIVWILAILMLGTLRKKVALIV
jgi:lipopolysaccharide transport system permease protein